MKAPVLEAGRWLVGCGIGSSRGGRKGGWEQLIQGFVGQAESFALCSVSERELPKVFMKAEEGRARKTILGEARSGWTGWEALSRVLTRSGKCSGPGLWQWEQRAGDQSRDVSTGRHHRAGCHGGSRREKR